MFIFSLREKSNVSIPNWAQLVPLECKTVWRHEALVSVIDGYSRGIEFSSSPEHNDSFQLFWVHSHILLLIPDRLRINQAVCCLEIFRERERKITFLFCHLRFIVSDIFSETRFRPCIFAVSEKEKCLLMWMRSLPSNKSRSSHQRIIKIHIFPTTYGNTSELKC